MRVEKVFNGGQNSLQELKKISTKKIRKTKGTMGK
jgi:hypothetical protein